MERKSSKGEKFKLQKLPSKEFIPLLSSRRRTCPVLKHNRVSEVFKGSKEHDFEYYTVKEITFSNGNLICVIINVSFTFDFTKLLENPAQICDRCSLEYLSMLSRFHSRFRINFFQK